MHTAHYTQKKTLHTTHWKPRTTHWPATAPGLVRAWSGQGNVFLVPRHESPKNGDLSSESCL